MSEMRFHGWGTDGHDRPLPARAAALLRSELGTWSPGTPPPARPEDVVLPESSLGGAARDALVAAVGVEHVRDDHATRVRFAIGRSYPDLVRIRLRRLEVAPDAVVSPGSVDEVSAVLAACVAEGVAVVPFGGGSSVVGGLDALRGAHASVVALDLRRLDRLVDVDPRSQLATFQAGVYGPAAEAMLAEHGLTLGHFPQSFEHSTVGGWVATRGAGQASTGYGRIDALVRGVRLVSPTGELKLAPVPATAAGPDLRSLVVGSEGTLGVVAEATLRVRPRPAAIHDEAWLLPGFAAGTDALRELVQSGLAPAVTRLSDEEETRFTLAAAGGAGRALEAYARVRRVARPCMTILGFEESSGRVLKARRRAAASVLRAHGAVSLGSKPGAAWRAGRYHGPYLRDTLMTDGLLVDTLETATTWTGLLELYRAVGAAIRTSLTDRGTPPLVGCHVSHLYPTGASLYFTFLAAATHGAELDQWQAAKTAAGNAITAAAGTITHHHAVGRDHEPWLEPELGPTGTATLKALRAQLDPTGIMNPGKLTA